MNIKSQLEQMVEQIARQFAAEKMGLVKDPLGERLPYELWKQTIPQARDFLNLSA